MRIEDFPADFYSNIYVMNAADGSIVAVRYDVL
jgi:hypothetical protein